MLRQLRPRPLRRQGALLFAATAMLLSGVAAACGDDSEAGGETAGGGSVETGRSTSAASSTSAAAPPASTSVPDRAAFPATVETKFGDVTIEEPPERVVALGWGDAETALALGVQPVGASDWLAFGGEGVGPWAEGLYDEAPTLIGTMEPSYEAIAELRPDLILDVKSSGEAQRYELLSQIAPTVGVPEGGDQWLVGWRQQVTMIGEALGQPDQAQQLIDDIDATFAAAADEHPEFEGQTITVGAYSGGGYGAYVAGADRVRFMEQLGFVPNPNIGEAPDGSFSIDISNEQLERLDADLVVMMPIGVEPSVITDDPVFQAIPAVRDGRSIVFGDGPVRSAFSMNSVLSIPYAIDKVVPRFADALDGS